MAENEIQDDSTIFVGSKPFMNYVTGIVMQFKTLQRDEILVKARGKFISKAVDVTEVARKRFLDENVFPHNILIMLCQVPQNL